MSRIVVLFALGILLFYQLPWLPDWGFLFIDGLLLLVFGRHRWRRHLWPPVVGFTWAHLFALLTYPPALPVDQGPRVLSVSGQVISMVERRDVTARFVFAIESLDSAADRRRGRWRVRLNWRDAPPLVAGDRLTLSARLKPAHGFAVPGAWDYEGWLYRQGIRYTGYVVQGQVDAREERACCLIERARTDIADAIARLPLSPFAHGVIRALVIGDKSSMSADDRRLFRVTGTSHLMAISGLHIGLVAAIGLLLFAALWRRIPWLTARVPARVAGAVLGLLPAIGYALLAGLGLPTQRALIMYAALALGFVSRREHRPDAVLAMAAAAVLVWDPASIVAPGFWLSFGAVAVILATLSFAPRRSAWRSAVRIQLTLSIALWPLLALFGLPLSLSAPLVNLVLVPLFALFIVPASLLGAGLLQSIPAAGAWLLTLLGRALDLMQQALAHAAAWGEPLPATGSGGVYAALVALTGIVLLLMPRGFPLRPIAVPLLIAVWLPPRHDLQIGDFSVHVLDVGQGLSTVVATRRHTLVYDTGPRYPSGFSAVDAAVLPFLAHRRRSHIDRLVLSHGDNDHAGGAASLSAAIGVGDVYAGEPERVEIDARRCRRGDAWFWDGVAFEFLHPAKGSRYDGNNASCVLRVSNGRSTLLLSGDIERAIERRLITDVAPRLAADLLIAPHHGSRSSSSPGFVAATSPSFVVYSAGWGNRYGFPAKEVTERWAAIGALGVNTATAGTIGFRIDADTGIGAPDCERIHARRFWWHDSGSAAACHAVSSPD